MTLTMKNSATSEAKRDSLAPIYPSVRVNEQGWKVLNILLVSSLSLLVITILALSAVPPVSRDALTHHLYVPKLYLQGGGIYEIPGLEFSYYPMNLDLLYMIPLYFKNDIAPKFIHFAFALTTAVLIFRYLTRRLNKSYAMLGSLFFLSIPVIVRLSSTVYVDLGLIFFLFTSLLYLFQWIENEFNIKYLIVSAVFCGLGLGTKYNGLIGLFLLGLFTLFVYSRYHSGGKSNFKKSIGFGAVFVVIALLVYSPWMIRNVVWTGNPLYPLYNGFFNRGEVPKESASEIEVEKQSRMSHVQIRKQIYGESGWEIALIPLRVFFNGRDDDPKYFDGKTNPFLFLLSIFAFFGIRSDPRQLKTEKMMMFFFSLLFLLFAFAQRDIRIRYFAPVLPPLVILAIFGLHNIQKRLIDSSLRSIGVIRILIVFLIVGCMLGLNTVYIVSRFQQDQPIAYITGKTTRDEYIQKYRPEYASFQYANKHLPRNSRMLGLYIGNRGYYSDIEISFNIALIQQFAAKADSARDVLINLRANKFTHLIVNFPLFNFWVKKYSLHERKILKEFFDKYVAIEFSKDGCGLMQLSKI